MNIRAASHHKEARQATRSAVREQGRTTRQAASKDNETTQAQQERLPLRDRQIAKPLPEQGRMPRARRRRTLRRF